MFCKKIVFVLSLTMHNISHTYAEDASTEAPHIRRSLSNISAWTDSIEVTYQPPSGNAVDDFSGTYERTEVNSGAAWKRKGNSVLGDIYLYESFDLGGDSSHLNIGDPRSDTAWLRNDIADGSSLSSGWVDAENKEVTLELEFKQDQQPQRPQQPQQPQPANSCCAPSSGRKARCIAGKCWISGFQGMRR